MGLDFLRDNGGRRLRQYDALPFLLDDGMALEDNVDADIDLNYEAPQDTWAPTTVTPLVERAQWNQRPVRFVDGKDVGSTIAWLQTQTGEPVPVRLAEIGAIVLREGGGELRREFARVERVVSMMVDPFPWEEVESFARALQAEGMRLLPCSVPEGGITFDFERMRKTTQNGSNEEMLRLERVALSQGSVMPTLVDGRLEPRASAFDERSDPVVGLIKTHAKNYLHSQGWRTFYALQPGQRTPAFALQQKNLAVVSWYLRLAGEDGAMPNWGIVRLEIAASFFERTQQRNWAYVDRLSGLVQAYRCHDPTYERAPVSIYPIQRAEENLGALFMTTDRLISHFYHLTHI